MAETKKQIALSNLRDVHLMENVGMSACEMCISIGKYTVSGQNDIAPSSPITLLKNGNVIPNAVVAITYAVLHRDRNRFKLQVPNSGMVIGYSVATNLDSGHCLVLQSSTSL